MENKQFVTCAGQRIPVEVYDTIVIGSGAAGFSAADRLTDLGCKNVAVLTENTNAGTSRNAGSDKQTYYKLTLYGHEADSVEDMASTLMADGHMDGDIALCEAALSARCFLHLAESGVPFPHNEYGEYVGYKTDHDPRERATSAGPYTSRMMTEVLERRVREKNIPIISHRQVIRFLTSSGNMDGVLCLNLDSTVENGEAAYSIYRAKNVITATGGPAEIYSNTVYPSSQHGATGLMMEAGAKGRNLTEWQYGLASTKPRWNVSGTYMQALPRLISTKADGSDGKEFLIDYFSDKNQLLLNIFLKGYQWPFDVRKVQGSSLIDILVFLELEQGRRVFLDYTVNPCGGIDFSSLPPEARTYLERSGACFGTPFDRLLHMNEPAVAFYREHGVDLSCELLEISLCAQHNNGGIAVDKWWRTAVPGLYCVGEAAGTHGVYRPGGSALNSGQVGALRAAMHIHASSQSTPQRELPEECLAQVTAMLALPGAETDSQTILPNDILNTQRRMSLYGAAFRSRDKLTETYLLVQKALCELPGKYSAQSILQLSKLYRLRSILLTQAAYLFSMMDYAGQSNKSRGSALYYDPAGKRVYPFLPERFIYSLQDAAEIPLIQEIQQNPDGHTAVWRKPNPLPSRDTSFENAWKVFRNNGSVF